MKRLWIAAAALVAGCGSALAYSNNSTAADMVQRDIHQQQRIERGLSRGALTPREVAELQRSQAQLDRLEAWVLRDGSIAPDEARRVQAAQDDLAQQISSAKHNPDGIDPDSPRSRRLLFHLRGTLARQEQLAAALYDNRISPEDAVRATQALSELHRDQVRIGFEERRYGGGPDSAGGWGPPSPWRRGDGRWSDRQD